MYFNFHLRNFQMPVLNLTFQNLIGTLFFTYNLGQNIWYKVEKSSKVGQDFKSLLSNFACFLTANVKV